MRTSVSEFLTASWSRTRAGSAHASATASGPVRGGEHRRAARCAEHPSARASGPQRTGGATCDRLGTHGYGRARAPTGPGPSVWPLPRRTRQSDMRLVQACAPCTGPPVGLAARRHDHEGLRGGWRPSPGTQTQPRRPWNSGASGPANAGRRSPTCRSATAGSSVTVRRCHADRRHPPQTVLPALCRLRRAMAVRDLPRQPRRLRRIGLLHRPSGRHLPRRPRHCLRPLPQ
jgi:hypothetical protein